MSRPPINPDKTVAGIALDPQTLERVIPESKRPDGSLRKQIKIRPGFTPQEDVRRFRGSRQAQMDANALPKGHIVGWVPPAQTTTSSASTKPMSKSAKKNAKRREKKAEEKKDVPDNWEDEEEEGGVDKVACVDEKKVEGTSTAPAQTKSESKPALGAPSSVDELSSKLEKLGVK